MGTTIWGVLNEIIIVLTFGFISWNNLLDLIGNKSINTEPFLSGRGASQELKWSVDLVTEMKKIKHYYNPQSIESCLGIEN